jgi:hypothetical protein
MQWIPIATFLGDSESPNQELSNGTKITSIGAAVAEIYHIYCSQPPCVVQYFAFFDGTVTAVIRSFIQTCTPFEALQLGSSHHKISIFGLIT